MKEKCELCVFLIYFNSVEKKQYDEDEQKATTHVF